MKKEEEASRVPSLKLITRFYQTDLGKEPVREWLKSLSDEEKKKVGKDIMKVQFAWPIGPPLVKKLFSELWEIRTDLGDKKSRVIFTLNGNHLVLLHGFIKKTQKTPTNELKTAKDRLKRYKEKGETDEKRK
jgi:phage-related protein